MRTSHAARLKAACLATIAILAGSSCNENLPTGPATFGASIRILVPHDTVVIGDSSAAQAQALDSDGHVIQSLTFNWATADAAVLDFAVPASGNDDAAAGRTRTLVGKKSGRSVVTLSLPDSRFSASNATRTQTVVVGGVRILSTHDSTLTAVNDTVRAIAAGLVRSNGALVTRVSQGLRWTHLGTHTSVIGTGDTIRYIARSNGADTIIASSDFCLAGAKCADTAIVRVSQQLTMTLSTRSLVAWSFADSLAPTVTLVDRRGNGLPNSSIRFFPVTAADSAIVRVAPPVVASNFATGVMGTPRLVSIGNGTARVSVVAFGPDGFSVIAVDSVSETVRQVARRIAVEPLRAVISAVDSIPVKAVARDARGAVIADAALSISTSGLSVHAGWAGPTALGGPAFVATLTPSLSGVALPASNPEAPQITPFVDESLISVLSDLTLADRTVVAGSTAITVSVPVLDSLGQIAVGKWVRFGTSFGPVPDSAQVDGGGTMTRVWVPPDSAGTYTLTGVRGAATPLLTLADSAGRIVVRRSVTVVADVPSALKSSVGISPNPIAPSGTGTITILLKDRFGNPVKTATPAAFTIAVSAGGGTLGAPACNLGVCTVAYTAPAAPAVATLTVKLTGGADVLFSPLTINIQ